MKRLLLAVLMAAGAAHAQVVDDFENTGAWQAVASDGVRASLHGVPGREGQGMRLDFDFGGAAGYAAVRRALPLDFGDDYEISFWLRADAPLNNLEFKLVDASGDNVWWVSRPNFAISREWQRVTFKKRHVSFAWGPAKTTRCATPKKSNWWSAPDAMADAARSTSTSSACAPCLRPDRLRHH